MQRTRQLLVVLPILFGMEGVLAAQAMIEHGTASAASSMAAGPARNVGRSTSGVAHKLESVVNSAPQAAPAVSTSRSSGGPGRQFFYTRVKIFDAFASHDTRDYENPRTIRTGMPANDELISRFGPPVLQITGGPNAKSWTFLRRENIVQLDMQGEKVSAVDAMNPQQSAVTLPIGHGFQTGH